MKSTGRGIKGKVVMMYSKYAGKAQTKSAPSVTTHAYQPSYPSSIDATATAAYAAGGNDIYERTAVGGNDINKRAAAYAAGGNDINKMAEEYIKSVRERIKNEQKTMS